MADSRGKARVEDFVGSHPILLSVIALAVSTFIEVLQAWPEFFSLGHELGEVVRNLGYGIAAAFAFNWIMVEVPRKREERRILDAYWGNLSSLASSGAMLLLQYRELMPESDEEFDTQTKEGMKYFLGKIPLIESSTPKTPGFSMTSNGVEMVGSDPYAGTTVLRDAEAYGQMMSPFVHRLEPKVGDAVTELTEFCRRIYPREMPVYMAPGKLDREIHEIWEFVKLSRMLRKSLREHYPEREIQKFNIVTSMNPITVKPLVDADL